MKFQQFSSPVMAKGLEDTAFYRYNRLLSLNDVGSDPDEFGTSLRKFHAANKVRFHDWPHTMLAGSTHDSKRSEDVRARINVLSEMAPMWSLRVREWKRFNRGYKKMITGKAAPSPNDEYLLYQTLVGAWPFEPFSDQEVHKTFCERIENYMLKAMREAKENTSWINQNSEYEGAVTSFVKALLSPSDGNHFLKDFLPFQRRIARIGLWNSLSQTLLKLTCPGVPDIYQGNELWDFSLVDPDNRRPVDYGRRQQVFGSLRGWGNAPQRSSTDCLMKTPEDGRIKAYLIWKTLCFRQQHADVFQQGEYIPLAIAGVKADHVVAFARRFAGTTVLVAAPRLISGVLDGADAPPVGQQIWGDTQVVLPSGTAGKQFQNVFTGERGDFEQRTTVSKLLDVFPVALCLLA